MLESHETVNQKVLFALKKLLSRDIYLLINDSSERSIAHRLAVYLEEQFPDWCVDCEYNRNGLDKKILDELKTHTGRKGRTVLPDIVIHHRGTKNNLLVIEIKKKTSPNDFDLKKLHFYKMQQNLQYQHALYIGIGVGNKSGQFLLKWI
ncbi:hypothetical protein [Brevibacillus dissolubilis]|uniref:hypothetical protein n=1 Tax=Brevibacillus dissolubilis TaxID=1844116 RepID=UPI0011166B21|nr:hypothetical protein [Brevibacillus dissolubilis]